MRGRSKVEVLSNEEKTVISVMEKFRIGNENQKLSAGKKNREGKMGTNVNFSGFHVCVNICNRENFCSEFGIAFCANAQ